MRRHSRAHWSPRARSCSTRARTLLPVSLLWQEKKPSASVSRCRASRPNYTAHTLQEDSLPDDASSTSQCSAPNSPPPASPSVSQPKKRKKVIIKTF